MKPIFALDLGTTKFCMATLMQDRAGRWETKVISVPAAGMRRGMLSEFSKAKSELNRLIEKAEKSFGCDISDVVVGIAGSHLGSRHLTKSIELAGQTVAGTHKLRLIDEAEKEPINDSRDLLHCIPLEYAIDGREPVREPEGFSAYRLGAKFLMIDADRLYMKDVVRLCNQCGLRISNLYSEPFASASVINMEPSGERGKVIADIGGGTTDGIVFKSGLPQAVFTINIGGIMMTSDLAIGLYISEEEADYLKRQFSLDRDTGPKSIVLPQSGRTVTWQEFYSIINPRLRELAEHMARALLPYKGEISDGLSFTGGGAQIKGLDKFLEQIFKIPVSVAKPCLPINQGNSFEQFSMRYATVLGLLNLEYDFIQKQLARSARGISRRIIGQFVNWIKELS